MSAAILVVREFDKFSEMLVKVNLNVVNFPAIKTLPVENFDELDEKLGELKSYDGVFLTSPKAAEIFLQRLDNEFSEFRGKVYVLGNRTKTLFEKTNFQLVYHENADTAEELIASIDAPELEGKKFLFLRGNKSLRTISELLKYIAAVDEIIVYRTIENLSDKNLLREINEKLRRAEFRWICFFSPSGVESFINAFGESSLKAVKIAAIGKTTARCAAAKNLKIEFISAKANAEDFARGLIKRIKEIE